MARVSCRPLVLRKHTQRCSAETRSLDELDLDGSRDLCRIASASSETWLPRSAACAMFSPAQLAEPGATGSAFSGWHQPGRSTQQITQTNLTSTRSTAALAEFCSAGTNMFSLPWLLPGPRFLCSSLRPLCQIAQWRTKIYTRNNIHTYSRARMRGAVEVVFLFY
jgi:hypothetical protein